MWTGTATPRSSGPSGDWYAGSSIMYTFNGKHHTGVDLPGMPQNAPGQSSNALDTPFVLGDTDGDGDLEAWGAPHPGEQLHPLPDLGSGSPGEPAFHHGSEQHRERGLPALRRPRRRRAGRDVRGGQGRVEFQALCLQRRREHPSGISRDALHLAGERLRHVRTAPGRGPGRGRGYRDPHRVQLLFRLSCARFPP